MQSNSHRFIQHRIRENKSGGIIRSRIDLILHYMIDCYLCMLEDGPEFSSSKIKETATYKFEDYLSDRFVDDYLRKRKAESLSQTQLNQIIFTKQSSENYIDCNTKLNRPDLIDIYITNIQLDKELSSTPQPYFAIECKRIRKSSCFEEYVKDIQKFANREHTMTRLPYEGQIAFIENSKFTHCLVAQNINKKLLSIESIDTIQVLESKVIHEGFKGSYYSKHFKNFGENNGFAIYHLLFDYTKIVID